MAYQSIQGTASGRLDLLNKIKDFLVTTVGWTLHDDQSADARSYYVFKSTGESGAEDIYLRFQIGQSSGRIIADECFDGHGIGRGNRIDGGNFDPLDIGVVLDDVMLIGCEDRCIVNLHHHGAAVDNSCLSDSNRRRPEPFDGTAVMAVVGRDNLADDEYMIEVGIQPVNEIGGVLRPKIGVRAVERFACTGLGGVVPVLESGHFNAAGAKIGEDPQPVITGYYNMPNTFYAVNKFDGWTSASGQRGRCGPAHGNLQSDTDPERRYDTTILFPWLVSMNGADSYQELRGELIEIYATGGANVASEDTVEIGSDSYRVFNLSGGGWCAIKE